MSPLRIGWATPWNAQSAIAQSASGVALELCRRGHALTILRTEIGEQLGHRPLPAPGPVHHLIDYPTDQLQQDFDIVVAHIGDYLGFHGALPTRMHEFEFVGVFHDAFLANSAGGWHGSDTTRLRDLVIEIYGNVWPSNEPYLCDTGLMMRHRPMLEWLARHATGAVAHSHYYLERLRRSCPGPVAVIPLAFTAPDLPPPPCPWYQMTIAVVGRANPNKQIDQVMLAIAASPLLRACCRLRLIGAITPAERERLTVLALALRLEVPEFTGWVTDQDLRWRLRDVDVISCLRNPVLEGASASLILAQTSARPTLVTDHGCYAEVPADTVLVCSPDHEARDVLRHLEWLISDPAGGLEIGRRAKSFALQRHAPAAYADRLLTLLRDVIAQRPIKPRWGAMRGRVDASGTLGETAN